MLNYYQSLFYIKKKYLGYNCTLNIYNEQTMNQVTTKLFLWEKILIAGHMFLYLMLGFYIINIKILLNTIQNFFFFFLPLLIP